MPRPLPPSLGESIPDPSEGSDNLAPQAVPEEILRVLGGTGLPGDIAIARINEDDQEPLEVTLFGEEEKVVPIIYGSGEGLDIAEKTRGLSNGADRALDILTQTERSVETNALYDDVLLTEVRVRVGLSNGAARALAYLDEHRPRTPEAQAVANNLYDEIIVNEATTLRGLSSGADRALDYLDSHSLRTGSAKTRSDILYDKIIVDETKVLRGLSNGKTRALGYLDSHTPKTAQGAQAIQDLRQQIANS